MSSNKILFVDLLYSSHGSYDDDFEAIRQALHGVEYVYLKCDVRDGVGGVLRTLRSALSFRYSKVVFLSARINQLAMLAPVGLLVKAYAIYHFMPNSRVRLHSRLLPVLTKFFQFSTYADGVSDVFGFATGTRPPALPSRIVDKAESERLLRAKFASAVALRVLVPGVRPGVRKFIDPLQLLVQLQQATGACEIRLFIQGESEDSFVGHPSIEFVPKGIPKDEYNALYRSCHVVAVEFDDRYEVRASGVILDAAASGCLILTTEHAITRGYGFPETILCDIERIGVLIARIRLGAPLQPLIPGAGVNEFVQRWRAFLDLQRL
jgi:hypothetical protein